MPRDAFKHVGTSAKTSILFLRKFKAEALSYENNSKAVTQTFTAAVTQTFRFESLNYPVFLASLENVTQTFRFEEILSHYKEFYMKQTLSKDKKVYFNDFVMVRVDKTMKDLFAEKPSSRWDGGYWDIKYDQIMLQIKR